MKGKVKIWLIYIGIVVGGVWFCYWSAKNHPGTVYNYNVSPPPVKEDPPLKYYISWDTTKPPPWRKNE